LVPAGKGVFVPAKAQASNLLNSNFEYLRKECLGRTKRAYRDGGGTTPVILGLGTRWKAHIQAQLF